MRCITAEHLKGFEQYLFEEERCTATVEKYMRDVRCFTAWIGGAEIEKADVIAYKQHLSERYAADVRCDRQYYKC